MGTGRPLPAGQRGEWRRYPRFRPGDEVSVAVETATARLVGRIRDISASGVCLDIAWGIAGNEVSAGTAGAAEFMLGGKPGDICKVAGRIARIDHTSAAFAFDRSLPEESLRQIVPAGGAVEWIGNSAVVHGVLHAGLAGDVLRAVEQGKALDLRHVTTIDSSGIGLAMLATERGSGLTKCHSAIQPMLLLSGVCMRCAAHGCPRAAGVQMAIGAG